MKPKNLFFSAVSVFALLCMGASLSEFYFSTRPNELSALTEKTTLANDDLFLIEDSAASGAKKKVKKSNVGGGGSAPTGTMVSSGSFAAGAAPVASDTTGTNFQSSKVILTAPATTATLTIANNKTLTANASLTLAGTDSTTITFQGTDTYVGRTTTDTLSNKTLTDPVNNIASTRSSDDTSAGTYRTGLNNSGGVTQWDAVYLNGSSQWVLADANGSGTYPCRGLAIATVATANATTIITRGTVRNDAWNWTPGGNIYLSTTAGGLTQTAPTTSGDKQQVIGYALDADTMAVEISPDYFTAP